MLTTFKTIRERMLILKFLFYTLQLMSVFMLTLNTYKHIQTLGYALPLLAFPVLVGWDLGGEGTGAYNSAAFSSLTLPTTNSLSCLTLGGVFLEVAKMEMVQCRFACRQGQATT